MPDEICLCVKLHVPFQSTHRTYLHHCPCLIAKHCYGAASLSYTPPRPAPSTSFISLPWSEYINHESTKALLIFIRYFHEPTSKYHLNAQEAELEMGGILLTYLQHTVAFVEPRSTNDRWRQIVLGSHDIHRYAIMFWRSHLLTCIQKEYRPHSQNDGMLRAMEHLLVAGER